MSGAIEGLDALDVVVNGTAGQGPGDLQPDDLVVRDKSINRPMVRPRYALNADIVQRGD